jgi:hypothetical protein
LLKEKNEFTSFISLIFLDFSQRNVQKLHTVEHNGRDIQIVLNKADLTTFILNNRTESSVRICKINEKKIIIGDLIDIGFFPYSFYDKCAYSLRWSDDEGEDGESILVK